MRDALGVEPIQPQGSMYGMFKHKYKVCVPFGCLDLCIWCCGGVCICRCGVCMYASILVFVYEYCVD